MGQPTDASDGDYRLLVSIANPEHAPQLLRTADDIAAARDGEILLLSVVELPPQTPLAKGEEFADGKRELLEGAADRTSAGVPVTTKVKIGHSVPGAIIETAEEEDSDAILVGWHGGDRSPSEVVLGDVVDVLLRDADRDVLVERVEEDPGGSVDSLLLPTTGGPHAEFAAEVGRDIARAEDAAVTVLHVVGPGEDRGAARGVLDETVELLGDRPTETKLVESENVAGAIVDETAGHDLTAIGATREGLFQRIVLDVVPETVAREADSPVLVAKRNLGTASLLRRLFGRR